MGRATFTHDAFTGVRDQATRGGQQKATAGAEKKLAESGSIDPLVDPKGLPHLGPVRMSLPRFEEQANGLWLLTRGLPVPVETLLDTTGSMGDNVDIAFAALPQFYDTLTNGQNPVLGRYDVQIANSVFGDVDDIHNRPGSPILCRSQFEMDVKIAQQLTLLVPSRNGCGNGKEDPQFGLFAAAYLTAPRLVEYGLRWYHFTVSDEPVAEHIDHGWLTRIFGDSVLEAVLKNGRKFSSRSLPTTTKTVKDLKTKAHAFFLQVGDRSEVTAQWREMYGTKHCIRLPHGTDSLHLVQACIIGLTEGVLSLTDADAFLREHGCSQRDAAEIIKAVANIPLGAQTLAENFDKLPKAGDLFRNKTDLWPLTPDELKQLATDTASAEPEKKGAIDWL